MHIELCRVSGSLVDRVVDDSASEGSSDTMSLSRTSNGIPDVDDDSNVTIGVNFVCQVLALLGAYVFSND